MTIMLKRIIRFFAILVFFFSSFEHLAVLAEANDEMNNNNCYFVINEDNELEWFCEENSNNTNGTGCWFNCE